jgi:hypothetical protein
MNFKKRVGSLLQKIGLKQLGIKFDLKVNSIYIDCLKYIRSIYIPILVKYRSRKCTLAINLDSDWLGLGARIVETIELLMFADENKIQLNMNYGYKNKGNHNYFEDLFEYTIQNKKDQKYTKIRHISELDLPKDYNQLLTIKTANRLFNKYLKIKNDILEEVINFAKDHFEGNILGLHYRGTDKSGEAPKVELDYVYEIILGTIKNSTVKYSVLFISSDENACIEFFKIKKVPLKIIWRNDIYRSTDGNQFHRNTLNNMTIINREALINCLLLSKCHLLIKTASILSDCCKIFNPDLEMIILNAPHSSKLTWWPASELNTNYLYKSIP